MICPGIGFPRPSFSNSARSCKGIRQIVGDSTGTALPVGDKKQRLCLSGQAGHIAENELVTVNRTLNEQRRRRGGRHGGLPQVLWHLDDGQISSQSSRVEPVR